MRRRVGGNRSREVASALVIAGGFARDRGDTVRAVEALSEARSIYARTGDARGTAAVENQLGVLEYGRGNLAEAERYMRSSLDYHRRSLGRHPFVAEGLGNLGAVLEDLGRPADAEAAYQESLDIALATLGEEHDIVSAILNNLGVLLSNQRRGGDAQRVLRRALAIDERKLGVDNPAVAVDLLNLAQAICRDAPSDEGAAMAARAARLLATSDGATAWTVGQARVIRGQCLTGLRRFAEAERELRDGLHALERGLGGSHRRVDSARVRLAELEQRRRGSP
jgi:tetratricopeptide (TPR) repeat protein